MHRLLLLLLLAALASPTVTAQATASARLKEVVVPAGAAPLQLTGYGLVVGLDRTGDRARGRSGSAYTVQSIANMLERFGIDVDARSLGSRNAAAVMVTATLDPFAGPGSAMDVTVASLGDARSLAGGILLQTPMQDMASGTSDIYAMAQGSVLTGTLLASASGTSTRTGPTNTGRVPGGGRVIQAPETVLPTGSLDLVLRQPDFTNAAAVTEAINQAFPSAATTIHAGLVRVEVPTDAGGSAGLMAALEGLRVDIDVPARVVVNERTGTIVAGGAVSISEVMITYGALTISTAVDPVVSQPNPFGQGETARDRVGTTDIDQQPVRSVVLQPNTTIAELAAALNELGLSARDVIAVFQAIDRAGALQGELVVL
ncbi:MAG: flagellar basal body P-ring protein FlgI [Rubricoccaceae bacterium]